MKRKNNLIKEANFKKTVNKKIIFEEKLIGEYLQTLKKGTVFVFVSLISQK